MNIGASLKVFDIVFKDRFRHRFGNIVLQCFLFTLFLCFIFLFYNMNAYLKRTSSNVIFYAFFKNNQPIEKIELTKKAIANWPEVAKINVINQKDGLEILKNSLGKEGTILNTLEINPLPYTLEIYIKSDFAEKEYLEQIKDKLKRYDTLDWYDSTEKYLGPLLQIKKYSLSILTFSTLTIIFLILLSLRTTTKIFFFKYKDTVSLLKLLGAENSFIIFPLVLEGFLEIFVSSIISSIISFYIISFFKDQLYLLNINVFYLPIKFYIIFILAFSVIGAMGGFSLKKAKEL